MRLGWLATLVAFMTASPASATWLEARTRHFVLYADMSEKGIRYRAMALERLDWAMRRFMRVEDAEDTAHNQVTVYWVAPSEFQSGIAIRHHAAGLVGHDRWFLQERP